MRDISKKLKDDRLKQLKILRGNYEKALNKTKDSETIKNLEALLRKVNSDIDNLS